MMMKENTGLASGLIRWAARVLSIVSAAQEWLGLCFFLFGVIVGFAVTWWKEGLGGGLTIVSVLAFYLLYGWLARGIFLGWWFLVFAIPGLLFLAASALSRSRKARVSHK